MAKARQQYFADEVTLQKENRDFAIEPELVEKLDSIERWAQVNVIETVKVNWEALVPDANKAVDVSVPYVEDTLFSTSSDDALSARQGSILYEYIQNLQSRWRYLSNWNCATWLAMTNPSDNPYEYRAWDYYSVSNVAAIWGTNYRPDGTQYIIWQASTTVETEPVSVSDFYLYDGTIWLLLANSTRQIAVDSSLSTTSTNPVENRVITNALNSKQDKLIAWTNIQIAADGKTISATDTTYENKPAASSWTDVSLVTTWEKYIWDEKQDKLVAWNNISIAADWKTISAVDTTYASLPASQWGTDVSLVTTWEKYTWNNKQDTIIGWTNVTIWADWKTINAVDTTYTAWTNISIDANNEISAVDTTYSAGTNISIDANNEISAVDTTYPNLPAASGWTDDSLVTTWEKYTWWNKQDTLIAWTNISIASDGKTISAADTTYTASDFDIKDLTDSTGLRSTWSWKQDALTAWTNIQIDSNTNTISATDTTYTAWANVSISNNNVISATDSKAEWWNITGTLSNQTDLNTALSWKQDTLIAWTNVQIASDGKTISATDTTYTAGTWISIDANNVISNTQTSAEWWNITWTLSDQTDLNTALSWKQDTLTAWNNISISSNTISADVNTKTFPMAFATKVTDAQAAIDWVLDWNNALIEYDNRIYLLDKIDNWVYYFRGINYTHNTTNDTMVITNIEVTVVSGTVTEVHIMWENHWFLETNRTYSTPFIPTQDWHPATKKYVDDSISTAVGWAVDDTAYSQADWDWVTNKAPSQNAVYDKISSMDTTISWKQDTLVAWTNIQIAADWKTISATDTTYTASDFDIKDLADTTGLRTTWNWKQDAISDLATIRTWAGKGATAIQPLDNVSSLTNDAWYITNAVNNLTNYYTKSETYTKSEVADLVANFAWFQVVATLPTTDIKTNIIYLLWPVWSWTDKYEEYIYSNNNWIMIWDTSIDLSPYFHKTNDDSDDIIEWTTHLFLTSAERTKLWNTSWTNSGDETKTTIQSKLGAATSSNDWYLSSADWATFNGKQNALTTQTAYTSQWSATKVPQITTNTLWQVTWITEVTITQPDISGLVTWPSSSTDWHLAVFDWATGKIIKDWWAVPENPNTKTFYLSWDTWATALAEAQAALDWYLGWKSPIICYNNMHYVLCSYSSTKMGFLWVSLSTATVNRSSTITQPYLAFSINNWSVTSIDATTDDTWSFLSTTTNYSTPYTPLYNGSPATKKYVDDIKPTSWSTAPSSTPTFVWQEYVDTTNDKLYVATWTSSSSDWLEVWSWWWSWDMLYSDYNWQAKTWATVTLDLASTITPSANFTVNAPSTIKDGQAYILRVSNWSTAYTMALGTHITNPYNTSTALTANWVDQFVFIAIGWDLELQPEWGGGGNTSHETTTATLTTAWWSSKSQTVSVTGVTASNTVIVSPDPANINDYALNSVYCSAQGSGTLTFSCNTVPSSAITVNVLIFD